MIRQLHYGLNVSVLVGDDWHIDHCFDYIRQSVLCSADITPENTDTDRGASGFGVPHNCRNPNGISNFIEKYSRTKYDRQNGRTEKWAICDEYLHIVKLSSVVWYVQGEIC